MTNPFSPFLRQLALLKYKTKHIDLISWVLYSLHERAMTHKVSVWSELYELKIYCIADRQLIQGNEISRALRNFLADKQKHRCCYCQRYLFNIAYARPVEHILPIEHYPRFSLTPDNLAVACYDCNHAKSSHNWWPSLNGSGTYPTESQLVGAFHSRFHAYNGHIRWFRYSTNDFSFCAYAGITEEGRKLCVDLLHKVVQKEILLLRDDGLKKALDTLNQHNADEQPLWELDAFMLALQDKILPN